VITVKTLGSKGPSTRRENPKNALIRRGGSLSKVVSASGYASLLFPPATHELSTIAAMLKDANNPDRKG
jgi:hypothetical protein